MIWFVASLVDFVKRDKNDPEQCKKKLTMLIISGAICMVVVGSAVSLIILVMAFLASM